MAKQPKFRKIDSGKDESWLARYRGGSCVARVDKMGKRRWDFVVACDSDIVDGHASTRGRAQTKARKAIQEWKTHLRSR